MTELARSPKLLIVGDVSQTQRMYIAAAIESGNFSVLLLPAGTKVYQLLGGRWVSLDNPAESMLSAEPDCTPPALHPITRGHETP